MLSKEEKQQIVKDFQTKDGDTGCAEVQILQMEKAYRFV